MTEGYESLRSRLDARRDVENSRRPRLILLLIGLLLGAAIGLYIGWVAWPTQFVEADPGALSESYRRDYTIMIAAAYAQDGDLAGARRRLASLSLPDVDAWLISLTVDEILMGGNQPEIGWLVQLATALGLSSPLMAPYQATP